MAEKLNNSLFATLAVVISIPQGAVRKCKDSFDIVNLILLPASGFFWMIMLWSMLNSFFTTFMPSPCLPTVINTAISVSKISKEYLGVAQALWSCSNETQYISSLSVREVIPCSEQTYTSI